MISGFRFDNKKDQVLIKLRKLKAENDFYVHFVFFQSIN